MMNNRKRELLYVLLEEQRIYPYAELCVKLHISERLLRYYIDETNQLLMSHRLPQIIKIRGKGVVLTLNEQQSQQVFALLQEDIVLDKESRLFSMLFSLLNDEDQLFAYRFQEKFSMSKSTVDADMRTLRKWVQEFHVTIMSIPKKGLQLRGDEWSIRVLVQNIMCRKIDLLRIITLDDVPYLTVNEQLCIDYLGGMEHVKGIYHKLKSLFLESVNKVESFNDGQLTLCFSVWYQRYITGHYVMEETVKEDGFTESIEQFFHLMHVKRVEQNEINYLNVMLRQMKIMTKKEQRERHYLFSKNDAIMSIGVKNDERVKEMREETEKNDYTNNLKVYVETLKDAINASDGAMQYERGKLNIALLIFSVISTLLPTLKMNDILLFIHVVVLLVTSAYTFLRPIRLFPALTLYEKDSLKCTEAEFYEAEIENLEKSYRGNIESIKKYQKVLNLFFLINLSSVILVCIINFHL